jgi:large subunit ribosomal protein L22
MEAIAKTKYLKGSPRKARLVIDMIRGVNVARALAILQFTDKRATDPIAKCVKSAIANATYKAEQQNIAIDPDDLWVKTCFVDMGPTKHRRRMRPAPQGRAYREQRHYCHITIEVSSDKPEIKPKKVKETPKKEEVKVETKAKAEKPAKKTTAKKVTKKAETMED